MIPKYLKIINFMSHKKTNIDFSKIPNATIIIGKEDGSLKASNAVGKTTLFNAIYFALFDASVGKKSRVIRNEEKKCEVEFIFEMSSGVYKIYRSRTKSTKVVNIFKLEDEWVDLSGRTCSHTEKTICNILGTSQKMFEKSSYFKQNDKFDLASATPEQRKSIIIDMLHLKEWSVYEKQAKIVKADIEKDMEVFNKTIAMIGDPNHKILDCEESLLILQENIDSKKIRLVKLEDEFANKTKELDELERKNCAGTKDLEKKLADESTYLDSTKKDVSKIKKEIKEKTFRLDKIMKSYGEEQELCNKYKVEYEHISSNYPEEVPDKIYNNLNDKIVYCNNLITSLEASFKILARDVPDDDFCPTCFTELNETNLKEIIKIKQSKLDDISIQAKEIKAERKTLVEKKNEYDVKIGELRKYISHKAECEGHISTIEQSMKYMDEQLSYIKASIKDLNQDLQTKDISVKKTASLVISLEKDIRSANNISFDEEIIIFKKDMNNLKINIDYEKNALMKFIYKKGGLEKEIERSKEDLENLKNAQKQLAIKAEEYAVYETATKAFGSHGIPAMIVSTVLDSLQIEVNSVLEILRPSIQIQFFLEKERNDGNQEDTLGMKFFVNSVEWDYGELSGGQSACISLALKFAISVINRKRCGADIKLLLLDEVDQALDQEGVESFFGVIKNWSKDMVILVITHNEQLRNMFDSFILVSKENGITSAEVVE